MASYPTNAFFYTCLKLCSDYLSLNCLAKYWSKHFFKNQAILIKVFQDQMICAMLFPFAFFNHLLGAVGETSESKLMHWTTFENSTELPKEQLLSNSILLSGNTRMFFFLFVSAIFLLDAWESFAKHFTLHPLLNYFIKNGGFRLGAGCSSELLRATACRTRPFIRAVRGTSSRYRSDSNIRPWWIGQSDDSGTLKQKRYKDLSLVAIWSHSSRLLTRRIFGTACGGHLGSAARKRQKVFRSRS